jgi:hypothetical protein
MLKMNRSVYDYYPLALAEGEGAGTAYEYYVKARLLHRLLGKQRPPRRILVGGLPEKYGLSMDFALLAQDWEAEVLFLDERPDRLAQFAETCDALTRQGLLAVNRLRYQVVEDMVSWSLADRFDLLLCCEVLQRLDAGRQLKYFSQAGEYAETAVVFAPNAGNSKHAGLSGLDTVSLAQLTDLAERAGTERLEAGWLDIPPFPPGLTRSASQRQDALSSRWQRFLFWGVNLWADAEGLMPLPIKRSSAHIVYIAMRTGTKR